MKSLGNVIWFLFCGLWQGTSWLIIGFLWCISLFGIPIGLQCFKFATLAFFPFGKDIQYSNGVTSFFANIIWIIFGGIPLATAALVNGLLLCITIIGIPFGKQCFKIAKLALMPFGATITKI